MKSRAQRVKYMPTVVIIGRKNVGKSTLFNRLVGKKAALVSKIAGTTRDRKEGVCEWRDKRFAVVDTAGFDLDPVDFAHEEVAAQVHRALEEADAVMFVVDSRTQLFPIEKEIAKELIRKKKKVPVFFVGNKAETQRVRTANLDKEWLALGLGAPTPLSALTGAGTGDFLDSVLEQLPFGLYRHEYVEPVMRIAIVGKPNAGKSSLVNAILREERVIVSPKAHTTVEPNDIVIEYEGKPIVLVDTVGMRRQNKVDYRGMEAMGLDATRERVRASEICFFVIDVNEPITQQDKRIAEYIEEEKRSVILVVNKLDVLEDKTNKTGDELTVKLRRGLYNLDWAPIAFVSAKTKQGIDVLIDKAFDIVKRRARVVTDEELAQLLPKLVKRHKPSRSGGTMHPVIQRIVQHKANPPVFDVFVGARQKLHFSYVRFLENRLTEFFDFEGTPITIRVIQLWQED